MVTVITVTLVLLLAIVTIPHEVSSRWVRNYGRNRGNKGSSKYDNQFDDIRQFERQYKQVRNQYYDPDFMSNNFKYDNSFGDMNQQYGPQSYNFGSNNKDFGYSSSKYPNDYGYDNSQNTRSSSSSSSSAKRNQGYTEEKLPVNNSDESRYLATGTSYGRIPTAKRGTFNYRQPSLEGRNYGYGSVDAGRQSSDYDRYGGYQEEARLNPDRYQQEPRLHPDVYEQEGLINSVGYKQQTNSNYNYPDDEDDDEDGDEDGDEGYDEDNGLYYI